ncbi:endonuclease domain-containing protein [Dermacoccaceae bacterium W4C1]
MSIPAASLLTSLARSQGHGFSAADAGRCGHSPKDLRRWIRDEVIHSAGQGAYYLSPELGPASEAGHRSPEDAYALREEHEKRRISAVLASLPPRYAASHDSALLLWGIPRYPRPTSGIVHVMVTVGAARTRRPGVRCHRSITGTQWHPTPVARCGVADALVQVTALHGLESGVVAADHALRIGLLDLPTLEAATQRACHHHGAARAEQLPGLVDAGSESVGESRTRLMCLSAGLAVRSQVVIEDRHGFIGRVDLLIEGTRAIVEFDGLLKYADDAAALTKEKVRQERLERCGWRVVRVTWADLNDPGRTLARIRAAAASR